MFVCYSYLSVIRILPGNRSAIETDWRFCSSEQTPNQKKKKKRERKFYQEFEGSAEDALKKKRKPPKVERKLSIRNYDFTFLLNLEYSGDLNARLVWYSNSWKLSDRRMVCFWNAIWIMDQYSNGGLYTKVVCLCFFYLDPYKTRLLWRHNAALYFFVEGKR